MANETRFYLIHGIGVGTLLQQHDDRTAAMDEARRQALGAPGTTFVVFEPVEAFRTVEPSVQKVWLAFPARDEPVDLSPLQRPGDAQTEEAA